jgi:aminopeptidase N
MSRLLRLTLSFFLIVNSQLYGQSANQLAETDVLHYSADIEPDISQKTINGRVTIVFNVISSGKKISFDCGDLIIEKVLIHRKDIPFNVKDNKLSLELSGMPKQEQPYEIDIQYHGSPTRGINFFPALEQVYTVFSTSHWLVCKDSPDDKATLSMRITCPSNLKVVASGEMEKTASKGNKTVFECHQSKAFPTYTIGFAAGPFNELKDSTGNLELRYLSSAYTPAELRRIFDETKSMIQFFEERSGVKYPGKSYTQVLGEGNVSQEMVGFTVMRLNYGKQVLADASEINLAAHELAHQWWGNSVTCVNWNHFWLNEGFAVFMSSAFKEFRFGRDYYLKDISTYQDAYEAVVKKGLDKPLTFQNWLNPTSDDRTLVYYKGAYVIHLLREQLGEKAFWEGMKQYTSIYYGKSVTSKDLQQVMEKVSAQDLSPFFSRWIDR